jgi:tetratricopeptide (TPR) repeat protein
MEIQDILKNIKSLFHRTTAHFTLTKDKKAFEPFGISALALDDHAQLIPYIDALIAYRGTLDTALRDIKQKVALKYPDKKSLIDSFSKENESYKEKQSFLDAEDRKEILLLESLDSVDADTGQKKLTALIEAGKEDQVRSFLLLKRKAERENTWAYFRHLEDRDGNSNLKNALEDYTNAAHVAVELFGKDDDEVSDLYNNIGSCHLRLGNLIEAEKFYQEALAIATGPISICNVYANLGNLEDLKGNGNKALEHHQKVVAVAAAAGEGRLDWTRHAAMSFLKLKRYPESIALLEQIVRDGKAPILIRAEDSKALGLAYSRMNRHRESVLCYQQAVKLFFEYYGEENEKFLEFYNDIGWGYLQNHEYQKAIEYFKKAIALEKNDENIYIATNNIGEAYYKAGDFRMAKKIYEDSFAFLKSKISEKEYPDGYNFSRQKIKECTDRLQAPGA